MNTRNFVKGLFEWISIFSKNAVDTFVSIVRIIFGSSLSVISRHAKTNNLRKYENCTILANGPSLKSAMDYGEVIMNDCDLMCVNMFCLTDYFWKLKPTLYFVVDGAYFAPQSERHYKLVSDFEGAISKVDWDMYLVVSTKSKKGGILRNLNNPNVHLLRVNTTEVSGFKWFRHLMYGIRMGMPRCQTVTNMALMTAVNMGYKNVYLYGADHGWTKDLRVDDNNCVCYGDRHVYNPNLTVIKKDVSLATLLRRYAQMFDSHCIIQEYAKESKTMIWNCTRDSFIDAYQRYKY